MQRKIYKPKYKLAYILAYISYAIRRLAETTEAKRREFVRLTCYFLNQKNL